MVKFRSCLMIEYVYTCLNMICLSVIMIANHVLVTCLTIKHDQDEMKVINAKILFAAWIIIVSFKDLKIDFKIIVHMYIMKLQYV